MKRVTSLACPKCNKDVLIPRTKIKYASDHAGAVCQNCGYTFTLEDLAAEGLRIVERMQSRITKIIN